VISLFQVSFLVVSSEFSFVFESIKKQLFFKIFLAKTLFKKWVTNLR